MEGRMKIDETGTKQLPIPFRIRLGVTGHREVQDEEILKEKVRDVLDKKIYNLFDENSKKIIRSCPRTPIGFSILTPLAEGADRLVAKEVLKFPDSRIEVVLPLAKEDHLEDFATAESRAEFEYLFKKARRPITLEEDSLKGEYPGRDPKEARRQAYEDVGRYIVDKCDVLIALWDGENSRGKGGTAEIIEYAKQKQRPVMIVFTRPPHDISVYLGHGLNGSSINQINVFNTYRIPEAEQIEYMNNMYKDLFDNAEGKEIAGDSKKLVKEMLLPFYVKASKLSKQNQTAYKYVGTLVYSLSAAAITSVVLGILFHKWSIYAFAIEFLILLTILFMVTVANWRQTQRKWIESRFLAEQIRSAIFFVVCNMEASPIEVPPYMRTAHRPDDWMVKIFYEIWNRLPEMKGCREAHCRQCIDYVRKHWIQDQIKFHKNKASKVKKISTILEWSGMAIFFIAMAAAISHLIFFYPGKELPSETLEELIIFLAIVLPAIGAAIGGIRSHREYSRMEKRSSNMEIILRELDEQVAHVKTPAEFESLLRATDELMLRETQDWLMLMKFVELKPAA
jgi:uncharacterized membrane protein YidH (DUF202 family)